MTSHIGSLAGSDGVGPAGAGRSGGAVTFMSVILTYFDSFVTKEHAFAKGSCSGQAWNGHSAGIARALSCPAKHIGTWAATQKQLGFHRPTSRWSAPGRRVVSAESP